MKKLLLPLTVAIGSIAFGSTQAASIVDNFDSYTPGSPASSDATYATRYTNTSANVGIVASTGLSTSNAWSFVSDQTVFRKDTSFDLSLSGQGSVTASLFFQYAGTIAFASPQIGFAADSTGSFTAALDLSARLTGSAVNPTLQLRNNNAQVVVGSSLTITNGNWYQLSYTLTRTATTDIFSGSVSLWNSTSAGVVGSQVGSTLASASISNSTLWNDTSLFFGVRENTNIVAMDNLNVSLIPEPSAFALLGLGLGLMSLVARRRR
jgi:hypothetical protein